MCVMGVQGKRLDSHGSQARLGELRRCSGLTEGREAALVLPTGAGRVLIGKEHMMVACDW
jgi:hypothetical protein